MGFPLPQVLRLAGCFLTKAKILVRPYLVALLLL
jgi:hypothetical protein